LATGSRHLTALAAQAYYGRMAEAALREFLAKTSFFGGLAGTPVFDRLADFATNLSEAFLNLTSGLIVTPFLFKFTVIDCPAHSFFGSPLCPIKFSFQLVSIW